MNGGIVVLDIVPDGEAALREYIRNKTTAVLGREVLKESVAILFHGYYTLLYTSCTGL